MSQGQEGTVKQVIRIHPLRFQCANTPQEAWKVDLGETKFFKGFVRFLLKQYAAMTQTRTTDRITTLALDRPDSYDQYLLCSFTDSAKAPKLGRHLPQPKKAKMRPGYTVFEQRQAVILAVAGSGKSQRLFDYLALNIGHYIVSGKVPSSKDDPMSLLNPNRGRTSQDSRILSEFVKACRTENAYLESELWTVLFRNRQITLHFFLKALGNLNPSDPAASWLIFQTMCSEGFDPFLEGFQILLLFEGIKYGAENGGLPDTSHLHVVFCLDEMQCEMVDGETTQPLDSFLNSIPVQSDETTLTNQPLIGAGTSLQYQKCANIIGGQRRWLVEHSGPTAEVKPITDLKKILTDADFHDLCHRHVDKITERMVYLMALGAATTLHSLWNVLAPGETAAKKERFYKLVRRFVSTVAVQHGSNGHAMVEQSKAYLRHLICCNHEPPQILNPKLATHSRSLLGRIRWSILFIERMLAQLLSGLEADGHLDNVRTSAQMGRQGAFNLEKRQEIYQNASASVGERIKTQLKARIKDLKARNHHFIVKDLYQTAVRAHLLHRPTIFQDTESLQMLEAGIASLRPSNELVSGRTPLLQELAEPLVLQAVIEHLNEEQGRHERILQELIFDNQDDSSTFGKVTEYYLGWVSFLEFQMSRC
jgi:hypothetical protein